MPPVLSVRGLTDAVVSVPVKINDREVGRIQRYSLPGGRANPASEAHWYTQMIAFDASVLSARAGLTNKLEVEAVTFPGSAAGNLLDDFMLKDVVCFFHQDV